jgi:hypothetical protein
MDASASELFRPEHGDAHIEDQPNGDDSAKDDIDDRHVASHRRTGEKIENAKHEKAEPGSEKNHVQHVNPDYQCRLIGLRSRRQAPARLS